MTRGALSPTAVARALASLAPRGPDGEGIWLGESGRVVIGHRRLTVIGLEHGAQPIASEDETIQLAVNGEFYGFEPIRRELVRQGHRFRGDSDSEILIHLYEQLGTNCLERLRGEFAFVLWDARRQRLFAARDRFGVKPLVYAIQPEGILLASSAKALFAAGVRPAWDRNAFWHASARQYLAPDETLFAGVRQIPPGHFLLASDAGVSLDRYWDLNFPVRGEREERSATFESARELHDVTEDVRHAVVDAIRSRLRSDVPVAFQLSGGLDSGSVVCAATIAAERPQHAFVMSFAAAEYDELAHATETANSCNAILHVVRISQRDILEYLPEAVAAGEGLAINGHLPAKYLLHREIHRRGFKVVLTGEGADEVFRGYAHLRQDYAKFAGQSEGLGTLAAANATSLGMMMPHGPGLPLASLEREFGFVPTFLEAKATLGRRVQSLMQDDAMDEFRGRDAFLELLEIPGAAEQLHNRHPVHQSLWLWCKTALAGYILKTLGDGAEMAWSVEGRPPLLDHRLFEMVRDLPPALHFQGDGGKRVFREAVRPFVPETLYRREKHPLDAPPLSLFSDPQTFELLSGRLQDSSIQRQPFFSPTKCRRLLEELPKLDRQERQAWDPALMTVLSTMALQQMLDELG